MASLICTDTVTGQFTVTRAEDKDGFLWSGTSINCNHFTDNTAFNIGSNGCLCYTSLTFSTENNKCESYVNEGEWS